MASILHVTASTGGGAGRAVERLHRGLQALGHDSAILCATNPAAIPGACVLDGGAAEKEPETAIALARWKAVADAVAGRGNRTSISNTLFNLGYPGFDLASLEIVRSADVIHIHWAPRILSIRGIDALLRLGKPSFWTQHDFWATTAGCHYPAAETDFAGLGAGSGHLAESCDLAELLVEDKRRAFDHENLTIVTLSEAAEACYRERSIFDGRRIVTALNGVDLERFAPLGETERRGARRMLGIEDDCILVVLLAQDVREKRKGFGHLAEALNGADAFPGLARLRDTGRIALMTIGARGSDDSFPGYRTLAFDSVSDDARLGRMIALADVTVVSSSEEVFSLALLEAWACGVPAVALPNGGLAEAAIVNGVNGLLAQGRPEARALGVALERFCADDAPREAMRLGARGTAERYGLDAAARRMLEIYGLEPQEGAASPDLSVVAPQRRIRARLDPRPSDWLAGRLVEPALLRVLAEKPIPAAPRKEPAVERAPAPQAKPAPAPAAPPARAPVAADRTETAVAPPRIAPADRRSPRDLTRELKLARGARRLEDGTILFAADANGHLVFGPNLALEPGRYLLTADLTLEAGPWSGVDLVRGASVVLECVYDRLDYLAQSKASRPLVGKREQRHALVFEAPQSGLGSGGFEFRIWARRGVAGALSAVMLRAETDASQRR